jgi:hypothetical protein
MARPRRSSRPRIRCFRQLPAGWLLTGGGVLLRLLLAGDLEPLLAALSGALLIPSLALSLGLVTGTSKVFEILYLCCATWGLCRVWAGVDFMGACGPGSPCVWLAVAAVCPGGAVLARWRQLHR